MLAHNLKGILNLVPEALEMVKKANLEEEFPLDSPDSASASYLRAHYLEKVAGKRIDPDQMQLITKAARLYGTKDLLDTFISRFNMVEKTASENVLIPVRVAEAGFEGDLAGFGFLGIEKTASAAEEIVDTYGSSVTSSEVLRYAGKGFLNKEAAIRSLSNRYYASKEVEFVKMARYVVDEVRENEFDKIQKLCKDVTFLDKQAGLDIIGFNFYREALIIKKADFEKISSVTLAGAEIPYQKVMEFGKDRIANTLGQDIADSMNDDPVNNKAVLESLPRDLQVVLKSLIKSV